MGKTIEVRLSDAQFAQLVIEAKASGLPLFGYCREKLSSPIELASGGTSEAHPSHIVSLPDDRISRIEDAVARLTEVVLNGHQAIEPSQNEPLDLDSLIDSTVTEAEAQGLTQHVPNEVEEVMNVAGVRPLSRRPIRFSPSTAPKHLQGLG